MALAAIEITDEPYPQQRQVVVHYPDSMAKTLHATDTLSGETVLAEFSCKVGDIFS